MDKHILIVDDEEMIRELLSSALLQEGYICHQAANVDDAFLVLDEQRVDLVISDIMMPGRSGVELLRDLKKIDPDITVLMITALDQNHDIARAVEAGTNDFLTKPINKAELLLRIKAALASRKQVDPLEQTLAYFDAVQAAC